MVVTAAGRRLAVVVAASFGALIGVVVRGSRGMVVGGAGRVGRRGGCGDRRGFAVDRPLQGRFTDHERDEPREEPGERTGDQALPEQSKHGGNSVAERGAQWQGMPSR